MGKEIEKALDVRATVTAKEIQRQPALLKLIAKKPPDSSGILKTAKKFKTNSFKSLCLAILLLKILHHPQVPIDHSILIEPIIIDKEVTEIKW